MDISRRNLLKSLLALPGVVALGPQLPELEIEEAIKNKPSNINRVIRWDGAGNAWEYDNGAWVQTLQNNTPVNSQEVDILIRKYGPLGY
jgi:hypothetical protein